MRHTSLVRRPDRTDAVTHDGDRHPPLVLSTERGYPGHSVRQPMIRGDRHAVHSDASVSSTGSVLLDRARPGRRPG